MRHKRHSAAWARSRLPLIFASLLMAAALGLASCSTPPGNVHMSSASDVLMTTPTSASLLDRQTGQPVWQHQATLTAIPPLISNNMAYVVAENPGGYNPDRTDTLEALSLASGDLQWQRSWKEHWTSENSPTIADGVVYLSESTLPANADYSPAPIAEYGGFIMALRASDGQQLWKVELPGLLSPATVVDGVVYVTNGLAVLALSGKDGQQLWQYQPGPDTDLSYYTSADLKERLPGMLQKQADQLYVQVRRGEAGQNAYDLLALSVHTGQVIWRYQSHGIMETPVLTPGAIYIAQSTTANKALVLALNPTDGSVLWTYQSSDFLRLLRPVLSAGVLYVSEVPTAAKQAGDVVTLRPADGRVLRRYSIPQGEALSGQPTLNQQMLYIAVAPEEQGGRGVRVIALDVQTGAEVWRSAELQPFGGLAIIVSQGQVYVFSPWDYEPDTLVVFHPQDGSQIWRYPTRSWIYQVVTDL